MSSYTKNYGLEKPEIDDKYSDFMPGIYGDNLDKLDEAFGGAKISFVTSDDYSVLETHDSKTLYFVSDDGKVEMYLGDVKLSGGESAPSSAALVCAAGGIAAVGVAENTSSDIGDITIGG